MHILLSCLLVLNTLPLFGLEYEGKADWHKSANQLDIVSSFLPYNPTILTLGLDQNESDKCTAQFPLATLVVTADKAQAPIDLIWAHGDRAENVLYKLSRSTLSQARALYINTHFIPNDEKDYGALKEFLLKMGFIPTAHWYTPGQGGNAIFLRKDFFELVQHSKIYPSNTPYSPPSYHNEIPLQQFFKKVEYKGKNNSYPPIDFIYMINLDEKPEKFSRAYRTLTQYGIYPYRFSAINGWKLPNSTLNQIGVRFTTELPKEKLLGRVYREVDAKEYISHEYVSELNTTYFSSEKMTRGAIGSVLSHLSILQDALDSGYQLIWILEDDIEVKSDPAQIKSILKELQVVDKKWDILFTDIDIKNKKGSYIPCKELAIRPNASMNPEYFRKITTSKNRPQFSRCKMRYGAYSLIINRSGIEKILNYYKSYSIFLPYDMDFWLTPGLRMYRPNVDIVSILPDSDV